MVDVGWHTWADGSAGDEARGTVVGISLSGMAVKVPAAFSRGALVDFEVWIGPSHSIRVVGEVVCREYSRHSFCHHVLFRAITDDDRAALGLTLRRMRSARSLGPSNHTLPEFISKN